MYTIHLSNKARTYFNVCFGLIPVSLLFSPAVNSILIGILAFISVIKVFNNIKKPDIRPINILKWIWFFYMLFLSLHVISLLYSTDLDSAFNLVIIRIPLLLIPFIFFVNIKLIDLRLILRLYAYCVTGVALFTLANSVYSAFINNVSLDIFLKYYVRYFYVSFMPYEMHPTYYGLFLTSTLAILINFIFKKKNTLLLFLMALIILVNIGLISSQMTTFSCLFIMLLYMVHLLIIVSKKMKFKYFKLLVLCVAAIFAVGGVFLINKVRGDYKVESKSNIVYRVKHFMENGDITRRKNWYSAYSVIKNNIIFGVGIGDGENEMQNYREKGTWIYKAKLNAHNQYLEEFVHFGIIGFGSLVIFIGLLFFISYKNLLSLLFCSILAFSMITESILNRQVGVTLFSFFIAILLYDKLITDESILIVRI